MGCNFSSNTQVPRPVTQRRRRQRPARLDLFDTGYLPSSESEGTPTPTPTKKLVVEETWIDKKKSYGMLYLFFQQRFTYEHAALSVCFLCSQKVFDGIRVS